MATDDNQVTAWATGRWVTGVNRWREVNWYVQVHAPSASLLTAVFTNSINGTSVDEEHAIHRRRS